MKPFLFTVFASVLLVGGLAGACFYILDLETYDPEVLLRWFEYVNTPLAYAKSYLSLATLVVADYAVLKSDIRGFRRFILLSTPFLLYFFFALIHWGFVGDAYIHYQQDNDLWVGGFSGAVIRMAIAYPIALTVSLVNGTIIFLVQRRNR